LTENAKSTMAIYKIVLFENWDVGRPIMRWYMEGKKSDGIRMTLGVDFQVKTLEINPNELVKIQCWRLAGQERFASIRGTFYKGAHASIIFYSSSNPEQGYTYVKDRYQEIKQYLGNLPILVFAVDAEKIQNNTYSNLNREIQNFVESEKNLYIQTRSDNIENIDKGIKLLIQMIIEKEKKEKSEILEDADQNIINALSKLIEKEIPLLRVDVEEVFGYKAENKRVIELYLPNLGLSTVPEDIGKMDYLKILDLESNNLSSLPESIGNLKSLVLLNISKNKFNTIPSELWQLKDVKIIQLNDNPWFGESNEYINKPPEIIRDFCRKRANIQIFISHAVVDFNDYKIKELTNFLENQEEIYKVFFCEEDLKGNIDNFMDSKIPNCQLLIFIATKKSVFNSLDCKHEMELARNYHIQIVPIKGADLSWRDLESIGLSRELGLEFNKNNFEQFLKDLYKYIYDYKRNIDLFNKEKGKVDKLLLELINIFGENLKSKNIYDTIKENFEKVNDLKVKFAQEQISFNSLMLELMKII